MPSGSNSPFAQRPRRRRCNGVSGSHARGLDQKPWRAKRYYAAIAASTLVGLGVSYTETGAVRALVASSLINGVVAPPLLVLVMLISGRREIMGARVNGRLMGALGWATTLFMGALSVAWLVTRG